MDDGGSRFPSCAAGRCRCTSLFTTHATLLGRYLAMNDPNFYDNLMLVDWRAEARNFNIEPAVSMERAAAHGSHVFHHGERADGARVHLLAG
ncbi:MAG: hypothetical protein WKG07_00385 [Hymenobacter sp.]